MEMDIKWSNPEVKPFGEMWRVERFDENEPEGFGRLVQVLLASGNWAPDVGASGNRINNKRQDTYDTEAAAQMKLTEFRANNKPPRPVRKFKSRKVLLPAE